MPPAICASARPSWMFCAAKTTALRPEAHTLFMVMASTVGERPAWMEAWRAGDWPALAWRTWPM